MGGEVSGPVQPAQQDAGADAVVGDDCRASVHGGCCRSGGRIIFATIVIPGGPQGRTPSITPAGSIGEAGSMDSGSPLRGVRNDGGERKRARSRAVRRHLQPLFRAGKYRGRADRAARRRLPGASAACQPTDRRGRSAAGAPSSRSAWSTQARKEAERTIAALSPFVTRGVPVVGLEPSCIIGFRDEIPALVQSR